MPFIPHTREETRSMLESVGVESIAELFSEIPSSLPVADFSDIPEGMSEMEMLSVLSQRAQQDVLGTCFMGAGSYDHHIPAAVWDLASRGEFLTAYTPYQAEASQGTLQLLYEFQTMMSSLTGLEVANASVYDGGSGLAEAILMAIRCNRRSRSRRVVIAGAVHPHYVQAARTLVKSQGVELQQVESRDGLFSVDACEEEDPVAVVVQQPNFYGLLEQVDEIADWTSSKNALLIAIVNPMTLAVLKPPGEWGSKGADIACGDGQPLGVPMASGGPSFGFLCTNMNYVRQLPGRIVGRTTDLDGQTGYTLTLQAREQHIRRAKATSNICTNQGLLVTAATIYLSIVGLQGLRNTATQCHVNTKYLVDQLVSSRRVRRTFPSSYFHECAIDLNEPAIPIADHLLREHRLLAGYPLGNESDELENSLIICATEKRTREEMDHFARCLLDALR